MLSLVPRIGAGRFRAPSRKAATANGADFPLQIVAGERFVRRANGQPFLIHGDTPWAITTELTDAQVDTYLDTRASQGFNAILFEAMNVHFSSNTPTYNNTDGNAPFSSTSYTAAAFQSFTESYWQRVDYIVNGAKSRGIVCFMCPAYLGFNGGSGNSGDQGWDFQVDAATTGNLQTFGATLASRYTQGNVVWVMGGDYDPPNVSQGWNIVTGMRTVRTSDLITFHGGRGTPAYTNANGQAGFNLNNIYTDPGLCYSEAATEYARSGPLPFFLIEAGYDGDYTADVVRRQVYQALCSGACGHFFGNTPIWGFGEPVANGGVGAASALSSGLSTTSTTEMGYAKALFDAYAWHLLEPKTDTSLVSSSLGTGTSRVCPALASDGSFALIYVPTSQTVTVVMSALAPSSVRARLYNPTAGTYSTVSGSPFTNTGTQNIASGGERILVLDAA